MSILLLSDDDVIREQDRSIRRLRLATRWLILLWALTLAGGVTSQWFTGRNYAELAAKCQAEGSR